MPDITTNLEAALIDQRVAGTFRDKAYAFVAVNGDSGWQLGVAVANERGYNPVTGKTFVGHDEAQEWADSLNRHLGRDEKLVHAIIGSTMGGLRFKAAS